jgi:early endosome antigen 1
MISRKHILTTGCLLIACAASSMNAMQFVHSDTEESTDSSKKLKPNSVGQSPTPAKQLIELQQKLKSKQDEVNQLLQQKADFEQNGQQKETAINNLNVTINIRNNEINDLKIQLETAQTKYNEERLAKEQEVAKTQGLQTQLAQMQKAIEDAQKTHDQEIESLQQQLKEASYSDVSNEIEVLEKLATAQKNHLKELECSKNLQEKIVQIEEKNKLQFDNNEKLQQQLDGVKTQSTVMQNQLEQDLAQIQELGKQLDQKQKENTNLQTQLNELQKKVDAAKTNYLEFVQQKPVLEQQIKNLEAQLLVNKDKKSDLEKARNELAQLNTKNAEAKTTNQKLQNDITQLEKQHKEDLKQSISLKKQLDNTQKELDVIKTAQANNVFVERAQQLTNDSKTKQAEILMAGIKDLTVEFTQNYEKFQKIVEQVAQNGKLEEENLRNKKIALEEEEADKLLKPVVQPQKAKQGMFSKVIKTVFFIKETKKDDKK